MKIRISVIKSIVYAALAIGIVWIFGKFSKEKAYLNFVASVTPV
jgi:hypothetical protein